MNIRHVAGSILAGGLIALSCPAQGPGRAEPAEGREGHFNHPRPQTERGGPGGPMTEYWLQRLQQNRPDEFARLLELRQNDPALFHQEVRRHLRQEIGKKLEAERPAIHDALQALPEEDREWLLGRLFGGGERGARGPGMASGPNPGDGGRRGDDDSRLRSLARDFRAAANEQERARLMQALRDDLQQSFSSKHELRRRELEQMEMKLKEARTLLQEREKNRKAIIDKRLKDLTEAPSPPP